MDIVFRCMGHIVIDDQRNIRHVNTTRNDIGGYQHIYLAVLEIQHHFVAFFLLQVAMHRARIYF